MPDQYSRRSFLAGVLACGTVSASASYLLAGDAESVIPPRPSPSSGPASPRQPDTVELRLATGQDPAGGRQLLFDMWNVANPTVQVRPYGVESGTSDERAVMLELARSGQADVVNLDVIHIAEFAHKRLITPIPLVNSGDFLEPTRRPSVVAEDPDRYWAAPFNTDVGMLFQRPLPDGRVEEPTLAEVITTKIVDGSRDFVGQLRPASSTSNEAFVINVLEHALAIDDTIIAADGTVSYELGRWQRALRPLHQAITRGRVTFTPDAKESAAEFDGGTQRYMRNWPVRYRELRQSNRVGAATQVRVSPLPIGILGGQSLALVARPEQVPPEVYDVRAAHALRLINFLTDVPAQLVLATHGFAPTRIKPYGDASLKLLIPHLEALRVAVENARPRPRPVRQEYSKFSDVVRTHAFALLHQNKQLPPEFMAEMKAALS